MSMFQFFQQQNATAAAVPAPPPATPPVVNLSTALGNMPDLDTDKLTQAFEQLYMILEDSNMTADKYMSIWAGMNEQVAVKGYPPGTGPQMMLVNIGKGELHVMHSVMKLPPKTDSPLKDIAATNSPFKKQEYVAVYGNRVDANSLWTIAPAPPKVLCDNAKKVQARSLA